LDDPPLPSFRTFFCHVLLFGIPLPPAKVFSSRYLPFPSRTCRGPRIFRRFMCILLAFLWFFSASNLNRTVVLSRDPTESSFARLLMISADFTRSYNPSSIFLRRFVFVLVPGIFPTISFRRDHDFFCSANSLEKDFLSRLIASFVPPQVDPFLCLFVSY